MKSTLVWALRVVLSSFSFALVACGGGASTPAPVQAGVAAPSALNRSTALTQKLIAQLPQPLQAAAPPVPFDPATQDYHTLPQSIVRSVQAVPGPTPNAAAVLESMGTTISCAQANCATASANLGIFANVTAYLGSSVLNAPGSEVYSALYPPGLSCLEAGIHYQYGAATAFYTRNHCGGAVLVFQQYFDPAVFQAHYLRNYGDGLPELSMEVVFINPSALLAVYDWVAGGWTILVQEPKPLTNPVPGFSGLEDLPGTNGACPGLPILSETGVRIVPSNVPALLTSTNSTGNVLTNPSCFTANNGYLFTYVSPNNQWTVYGGT